MGNGNWPGGRGTCWPLGAARPGMAAVPATLMRAAYDVVSPYLPMPLALTRERLVAEYGPDWNLGSPPQEAQPAGPRPDLRGVR